MDLNQFNEKFGSGAPNPKREPISTEERPQYHSYEDIRGNQARDLSARMGIDEESGIENTGHLIEIRRANDHVRISAHASTYAREALLFNDGSVIEIDLDRIRKEALQTVYSTNGEIEHLRTEWSYERNGYHGPYEKTKVEDGMNSLCNDKWRLYEDILLEAEKRILRSEPSP